MAPCYQTARSSFAPVPHVLRPWAFWTCRFLWRQKPTECHSIAGFNKGRPVNAPLNPTKIITRMKDQKICVNKISYHWYWTKGHHTNHLERIYIYIQKTQVVEKFAKKSPSYLNPVLNPYFWGGYVRERGWLTILILDDLESRIPPFHQYHSLGRSKKGGFLFSIHVFQES